MASRMDQLNTARAAANARKDTDAQTIATLTAKLAAVTTENTALKAELAPFVGGLTGLQADDVLVAVNKLGA